jgi:NH3-dependent NAD+ synthetase
MNPRPPPSPGVVATPPRFIVASLLRAITQNNNVFGLGGGITAAVMLVLVGRALDWRRELAAAVPAPMPH